MHITHATSTLRFPLGGAEKYALDVARSQRAQGHDVAIVTTVADGSVQDLCSEHEIDLRLVRRWRPYPADEQGPSFVRKAAFHALDLVDHRRVDAEVDTSDVLHVHRFQGFGPGVFRSRARRVVHTVHDYALVDTSATSVRGGMVPADLGRLQRARASWVGASVAKCDAVIFPSERTLRRHQELGFRHRAPVVLPHGWPGSGARPRTRTPLAGDEVTFGFIGKLEPHKGSRILDEAWGRGVPGARLMVAGVGSDSHLFRRSGIHYSGYVSGPELSDFFDRVDVLIVPSLWPENFPLVVAEGLLAGCAFVVTEDASPPLVESNVNGVHVTASASALRQAIESVVAGSQSLLPQYSAASLRLAAALDMATHLERLRTIYGRGGEGC